MEPLSPLPDNMPCVNKSNQVFSTPTYSCAATLSKVQLSNLPPNRNSNPVLITGNYYKLVATQTREIFPCWGKIYGNQLSNNFNIPLKKCISYLLKLRNGFTLFKLTSHKVLSFLPKPISNLGQNPSFSSWVLSP